VPDPEYGLLISDHFRPSDPIQAAGDAGARTKKIISTPDTPEDGI
jgi:hypothetical protein